MAFVPVPNTAQFNVRGTYLGEQVENTLYFRRANGWGAGDLVVGCSYLLQWFTQNVRANLSEEYVMREVYGVDLSSVNGPTGVASVSNDPGGPISAQPLPGNIALCVTFRTAARGRSFRGRNYVSGLCDIHISGNQVTSVFGNNIATAYQILVGADMNIEADWVVVSRQANGVPRQTGIATPVIAAVVRDYNVDSQRRRLAQRGV